MYTNVSGEISDADRLAANMDASRVPEFPVFHRIDFGHHEAIQRASRRSMPNTDLLLSSLRIWDFERINRVSRLHDRLVFRLPIGFLGTPESHLVSGKYGDVSTISRVISSLLSHGLQLYPIPLPEEAIPTLAKTCQVEILPDPDTSEYVYTTSSLSHLPGRALATKRRHIRNFLQRHGERTTTTVSIGICAPSMEEFTKLYDEWVSFGTDGSTKHEREYRAFSNLLYNPSLPCTGDYRTAVLRIEGVLAGISLLEVIGDSYATCHFVKCDLRFGGINEYMFQVMGRLLLAEGVGYLNHQEDAGFEGIRKSKLSFRPAYLYRKFSIRG